MLNRFLPPAPGITGTLLYQLAGQLTGQLAGQSAGRLGEQLSQRRHELTLHGIGTALAYGPASASSQTAITAIRLASWQRYGKAFRLPATLSDGWRMAGAAAGLANPGDAVLSCTDPPLLGWWLGQRLPATTRWVEWTMDLYPDGLAAVAGLPSLRYPRPFGRRPNLRLCLGAGQAAYLAAGSTLPVPHLILPAGVLPARQAPPSPGRQAPITLVYAGNLGRAHSPAALEALALALDPARFRLIIAAHGSGTGRLGRRLAGHPAVDWRDAPLDDGELDRADVHVVSLKPRWTHLCVPSKAVSALCRGRPLLFFGDGASDAWGWANLEKGRAAGWRVDLSPDGRPDPVMLAQAVQAMAGGEELAAAKDAARQAGSALWKQEEAALDALADWLIPTARRC